MQADKDDVRYALECECIGQILREGGQFDQALVEFRKQLRFQRKNLSEKP